MNNQETTSVVSLIIALLIATWDPVKSSVQAVTVSPWEADLILQDAIHDDFRLESAERNDRSRNPLSRNRLTHRFPYRSLPGS